MPTTIREQSTQVQLAAAEHLPADVVDAFNHSIQQLLEEGVSTDTVKVGDPLDSFTLDDATGEPVSLDGLVASGPAVIVFYRGGWCPYCNLALRTYEQELTPQFGSVWGQLGGHQSAVSRRVVIHRGKGGPLFHRPLRPG